jgi:cobalamin biosynthesis Mg chelatase CobN
MSSPEQQFSSPETGIELREAAEKQSERLADNPERERHPDNSQERADNARHEAQEIISRDQGKEKNEGNPNHSSTKTMRQVSGRERRDSYTQTMTHIQSQMSPFERGFSRLIHKPIVEKTSELVGSSIARPNSILFGSLAAFVLTSVVYFAARYYGYPLSGSETIFSFVVGWVIGMIFDYVKVGILGRTK